MSIKKFRLYANISMVVLITAVVLIFLFSNREVTEVKFLGWTLWTSPLYTLIFASANLGIITFLVSKRIRIILKQLQEIKQERKIRNQLKKEIETEKK